MILQIGKKYNLTNQPDIQYVEITESVTNNLGVMIYTGLITHRVKFGTIKDFWFEDGTIVLLPIGGNADDWKLISEYHHYWEQNDCKHEWVQIGWIRDIQVCKKCDITKEDFDKRINNVSRTSSR